MILTSYFKHGAGSRESHKYELAVEKYHHFRNDFESYLKIAVLQQETRQPPALRPWPIQSGRRIVDRFQCYRAGRCEDKFSRANGHLPIDRRHGTISSSQSKR